MLSLNNFH